MCCAVLVVYQDEYPSPCPLIMSRRRLLFTGTLVTPLFLSQRALYPMPSTAAYCILNPANCSLEAVRKSSPPGPTVLHGGAACCHHTPVRSCRGQFNLPVLPRFVVHLVSPSPSAFSHARFSVPWPFFRVLTRCSKPISLPERAGMGFVG